MNAKKSTTKPQPPTKGQSKLVPLEPIDAQQVVGGDWETPLC